MAVTVEPAAWPAAAPAATGKLWLRAVGFCGVDESVEPAELAALVERQTEGLAGLVEWGVLFKPGAEGKPRIPAAGWVARLGAKAPGLRSGMFETM